MSTDEFMIIGHNGGHLEEGLRSLPIVWCRSTDEVCVFNAGENNRNWYRRKMLDEDFAGRWAPIAELPLPVECMRDRVQCYVIQVYGAMCVQMADGRIVTLPSLKIWRVRRVSCDGGYIGKVWGESFCLNKDAAEAKLSEMLSTENALEEARGRTFAMYKPATVDGIVGWCSWQYGMMLTIDSFEVQP
jgi:hypothetical protein